MQLRLTSTFRSRLADLLLGQATGPVTPASAYIGTGAYDSGTNAQRPPANTMYAQGQQCSLTLTRTPAQEMQVVVTLPAASATTTYSEVGVYAADGTLLLHATFPPQTLSAGIEASFQFTLNPEDTV